LGVSNRTHALSRCLSLKLLEPALLGPGWAAAPPLTATSRQRRTQPR
jgi:hypothetical protein